MPRFQYDEDPRTGDRIVVPPSGTVITTGPLNGQCDCGSSVAVPRNGDAAECRECGAMYRYLQRANIR